MRRLLRIGILFMVAAVVLFAAFHFTRAQGKKASPVMEAPQWQVPSTLPADPHTPSYNLVSNLFTQNYAIEQSLEPGGYPLEPGPTHFYCWAPCTLEININADLGGNDAVGNWLGLGYEVDGQFSGWTAVTEVPSDDSWVQATWDWTVNLKPGEHSVQSGVDTYFGAGLWSYHNNYRIYMQH